MRKKITLKPLALVLASLTLVPSTAFGGEVGYIEPPLVSIPAGDFMMGSEQGNDNEKPVRKVSVPAFQMGKYEVTVHEFRQFIEATNYPAPEECRHELNGWFRPYSKGNWENNALNTSEFQPVVCINWKAADAYTKWLAKETGKPYRLPTEAEWEYAARAGTTTDYFFGNDEDRTQVCQYANTADLYGENILQRDANTSYFNWSTGLANCVDNSAYASIVGMYQPNQFGLHDIISNVLEMLSDCYVEDYKNAPLDGSARLSDTCERRSTRGGSWHWNNWPLAQRGSIPEDFAGGVDGFRIALDGPAPKQTKATKLFVKSLKTAQELEQKQRASRPDFPEPVTNLSLQQDGEMMMLNWDKSNDSDVDSYRVYANDLQGQMVKLLASNIKNTSFQFADNNSIVHEYAVVAVKNHRQSLYGQTVRTQAGWTKIPGRIEAETASENIGSSATFTSDVDGQYNLTGVGGIADNAKIDYQIDVEQPGEYTLSYRVATPRDTKGFTVLVNDQEMHVTRVTNTGGYHEWQTQTGNRIHLKKGHNKLTLKSLDNNWKLNWLALNLES